MHINKLKLENYRNYKEIEVEFDKSVNLILGENAQGKTNLLEAVYLASMGKSFRTSKDKELIKFDAQMCRIKAEYEKYDDNGSVEIAISSEGKKGIKVDGVNVKKISDLMESILTVIFSPEDLKIIKEEPGKRRTFIDRELCQLKISYFNNLKNYKKVLQQRNTYLKENHIDEAFLDVYNRQLASYGARIIAERREFVKKLNLISKDIHSKITNGREEIEIRYLSDIPIEESVDMIDNNFLSALKKSENSDKYLRNTSRGPHKDDMKVLINNIDARKYGSQGQQRTAALSLKLAEIVLIKEEKDESPILLLDDVMSELDNERQKFLVNSLSDVQIFLTTTELNDEVKESLPEGKIIRVEKGSVV